MAVICFLITLLWTVLFSVVQSQSRQVGLLKERIQKLETRLVQDIALLREEFYLELESIVKEHNTGEVERVANITVHNTEEDFQSFQDSISQKLRRFQLGLSQEKRVRRAIQFDLHSIKDKEEHKKTVNDEILSEIKIFRAMMADGRSRAKLNISQVITENVNILTDKLNIKEEVQAISELLHDNKAVLLEKQTREEEKRFKDCSDLKRNGFVTSGVYPVYPETMWRPLKVYCDMVTDGGGWTVFQRRKDGNENFNRQWMDYMYGFGNLEGEFWLGNEFIYRLAQLAPQELLIELEDFDNERRVAKYGEFSIGPSSEYFKLNVGFFSGNVTDSLISSHNGKGFSTSDHGPNAECSNQYKGGWWYGSCHRVNINGLYLKGEHKAYAVGMNWFDWRGYHYSLKFTEMKFRSK